MLHPWHMCGHRQQRRHVKGPGTFDFDTGSFMHIQLFVIYNRSTECQLWCCSQAHIGTYTGVICDLGWSLEDVVLLHWSCHSHSQTISQFQKGAWRQAGRKGARLNGSKTSIPSSQSQSTEMLNDAGCLQRGAGWKWVKEDPMSHLLSRYLCPSIIIIDMMGASEFCWSPFRGNFSKWKSITETLWKVLIPD